MPLSKSAFREKQFRESHRLFSGEVEFLPVLFIFIVSFG
jgi:hypothetical protein